MKANRTCIVLIMLLCANVLFAQRKEAVSISLDEIKDMPQKIITAYFKRKRIRSDALRAIMPSIGQAAGLCIP